jgi:hypothetical protein
MLTAILLYTDNIKGTKTKGPKPLYNISKSRTIVDEQISRIKKIDPKAKIIIAINKHKETVEQHAKKYKNIKIIEIKNADTINQASVICKIIQQENITDKLMIIIGSILFKNISINKITDSIVWTLKQYYKNFNIGCTEYSGSNTVQYMFYDLQHCTWSEIALLSSSSVAAIKKLDANYTIKQMFLFEMLNLLIEQESVVIRTQLLTSKQVIKLISEKDLPRARTFIK